MNNKKTVSNFEIMTWSQRIDELGATAKTRDSRKKLNTIEKTLMRRYIKGELSATYAYALLDQINNIIKK